MMLSALISVFFFLEHFIMLISVDSTLLRSALSAFLSYFCVFQLTSVILSQTLSLLLYWWEVVY